MFVQIVGHTIKTFTLLEMVQSRPRFWPLRDQEVQRTTNIHNFYEPPQVYIYGCETLFSILSYVKEKIKKYTYVTLMFTIPSSICIQGHTGWIFGPKPSINILPIWKVHLKNEFILDRVN